MLEGLGGVEQVAAELQGLLRQLPLDGVEAALGHPLHGKHSTLYIYWLAYHFQGEATNILAGWSQCTMQMPRAPHNVGWHVDQINDTGTWCSPCRMEIPRAWHGHDIQSMHCEQPLIAWVSGRHYVSVLHGLSVLSAKQIALQLFASHGLQKYTAHNPW